MSGIELSGGGGASSTTLAPIEAGWSKPADHGWLVWNFPVEMININRVQVAGIIELSKIWIRKTQTYSNMLFCITQAATVNTNCYACLYDSAGSQLGGTPVDQSTSWQTLNYVKTVALPSSVSLTAGSFVWMALLCGAATTKPGFGHIPNINFNIPNGGLTAAQSVCGGYGSSLTALPGSITPASINQNYQADPFWAALS